MKVCKSTPVYCSDLFEREVEYIVFIYNFHCVMWTTNINVTPKTFIEYLQKKRILLPQVKATQKFP